MPRKLGLAVLGVMMIAGFSANASALPSANILLTVEIIKDIRPPDYVVVNGTVKLSTTLEPLPGAKIIFSPVNVPAYESKVKIFYSDGSGNFTTGDLPAGEYNVSVEFPRMQNYTAVFNVAPGASALNVTLTPLEIYGSVLGCIKDRTFSNPIAGATVKIGAYLAQTDANGNFTITNIPIGFGYEQGYPIEIIRTGYQKYDSSLIIHEGSQNIGEILLFSISNDTEQESNNSFAEANFISLDKLTTAAIDPQGDIDYYKIHTDTQGKLTVNITNVPANIRPQIYIFDSAYNQLTILVGSPGQDFTVNRELPGAGDYYIVVGDYNNYGSSTLPYSLKAVFVPASDAYEPNNDFEHASPIQIGDTIQATIFTAGDIDYYKIHAGTQGMLTVDMTNVPANIRPQIYIFDSAYNQLTVLVGSPGQDFTVNRELPGAGDYYIAVGDYNNYGSSTSPYFLKASISDIWINNFYASPEIFSPNGDNIKDTTMINADFSESVSWKVMIKDSLSNLVRILAGTGSSLAQIWDGKDSNGTVVNDGIYTYEIDAQAHGSSAHSIKRRINVDNTPPTVNIISPNQILGGTVEIFGTANEINFQTYLFQYGLGENPASWVDIFSSNTPVTNGKLADWDTSQVPNGLTTLKLTAEDIVGNKSEYQLQVTLDNIKISNVLAAPRFINPTKGENSTIQFTLDRAANVAIKLYHVYLTFEWDLGAGYGGAYKKDFVDTLATIFGYSGVNTFAWNGRDSSGNALAYDTYVYEFEANAPGLKTIFYQPEYVRGDVPLENVAINSNANVYQSELITIGYTISQPAFVIIAFKDAVGAILWGKPRNSGQNSEYWDGRNPYTGNIMTDYNRITSAWTPGTYTVSSFAWILPDNSIVTYDDTLKITDLSAEAYLIDPTYSQTSTIHYAISKSANIVIRIYDPNGNYFRTLLTTTSPLGAGSYQAEWDGTDDTGKLVSVQGDYVIEINATTPGGESSVIRKGNIIVYR